MTPRTLTRRILVPLDGGKLSISALPFLRAVATPESAAVLLRVIPDATSLINQFADAHADAGEVHRRTIEVHDGYRGDAREWTHREYGDRKCGRSRRAPSTRR
jgi:hypothetical protein